MLPVVLPVPAATLVETYSTSTQYLLQFLPANICILFCVYYSMNVNHTNGIFFTNHSINLKLKTL